MTSKERVELLERRARDPEDLAGTVRMARELRSQLAIKDLRRPSKLMYDLVDRLDALIRFYG